MELICCAGGVKILFDKKIYITDMTESRVYGTFYCPGFSFEGKTENGFVYSDGERRLTVSYEAKDGAAEETVKVENISGRTIENSGFLCGYIAPDRDNLRFTAVPFRKSSVDGKTFDWNRSEFEKDEHRFCRMRNPFYNWEYTDCESAEGWVFYDGNSTFLVMKYAPSSIEWCSVKTENGGRYFSGAAVAKMGDPEDCAQMEAGAEFTFSVTRFLSVEGSWKDAYYVFRKYMASKGHTVKKGYSPRLNWNELYDNRYWYEYTGQVKGQFWHVHRGDLLKKYYNREEMLRAAKTAFEYGCECLYLDPGWDTVFASNVWDEERMGDMKSFAREIKEKYNLTLGLHTPLAPWVNESVFSPGCLIQDSDGNREKNNVCVMSPEYTLYKTDKMLKLCENGADFFLYDGSWYEKPCYDRTHGHRVPSTRKEHIEAIHRLSERVHSVYPDVVIEQHDAIIGPGTPRYLPLCCNMKNTGGDADEIWAFEFMNYPLDDFRSGRAYAVYYANLAYSLPFYLHIDLRYDNKQGIAFWWFASTCRHMGIGGTDEDAETRKARMHMVRVYRQNDAYYKKGEFYGIDELIHAHTIGMQSVIDFFNPGDEDITVRREISGREIGIDTGRKAEIEITVPAQGHTGYLADFSKEQPEMKKLI